MGALGVSFLHVESRLRSVVRIEYHHGILVNAEAPDRIKDPPHIAVQARNHGRVGSSGIRRNDVADAPLLPSADFRKPAEVSGQRVGRDCQFHVGDGHRKIAETRPVSIRGKEVNGTFDNDVMRILAPAPVLVQG